MRIESLYLRNFRNYDEEIVSFGSGVNLIIGNNAVGKTSLLEALYLLSTGRSFRTNHFSELIREGTDFFHLELSFIKDDISQVLKLSFNRKEKEIHYNQTKYTSFTPLIGLLPSIFYHPSDVQLLMGGPQERRRFLNIYLAQGDPLYIHHLIRYQKALRQRNELLKTKSCDAIEIWEQQMAASATFLTKKRSFAIEHLSPLTAQMMELLTPCTESLKIKYQPSFTPDAFTKHRSREMMLGMTLYGPHRDDLHFFLAELPIRSYASEGQKRTFIAALYFAAWEGLKEQTLTTPLLGIDDFPVHLDPVRQQQLFQRLFHFGQVFLTSPTAPSYLTGSVTLIPIEPFKIIS